MRKNILLISGSIAILAIVCVVAYLLWAKGHKNTVKDFSVYPCAYATADEIDFSAPGRQMTLQRERDTWVLSKPQHENIEDAVLAEFRLFMNSRIFIDDKRDLASQTKSDFEASIPTVVAFKKDGALLCEFELGKSLKLPTSSDERRWIFPKGQNVALRTFVPLIDYGLLLEQPTFAWRLKKWFESHAGIETVKILSTADAFELDKKGEKTPENPSGWQMTNIQTTDPDFDDKQFEFDLDRIATLLSLLSPLYVDDIAYDLSDDEKNSVQFAGKIEFQADGTTHTLEIGTPADLSKHPEWLFYGEGTRYIRFDGKPTLGIMSPNRLVGVFPSIADMRSKDIWKLDSTTFSSIEIEQTNACVRYLPTAPNIWSSEPCTSGHTDRVEIPNRELALFVKTLVSTKAVRYITPAERDDALSMLESPDASIRIFSGKNNELQTTLQLSPPRKSLFRYARVIDHHLGTRSPVFVITEGIAAILLRNANLETSADPTH